MTILFCTCTLKLSPFFFVYNNLDHNLLYFRFFIGLYLNVCWEVDEEEFLFLRNCLPGNVVLIRPDFCCSPEFNEVREGQGKTNKRCPLFGGVLVGQQII